MAARGPFLLISCVFLMVSSSVTGLSPQKRFEYKLSFKGPHLVQQDGSVPFWEHSGHAIASDESIRVTPSLRSKKGQVWSKVKNTNQWWEVEATFRISGRGRIGADGLAIWYTSEKGVEGPVFGSNDQWKGLAIFFDSFDNDNQHNNPYVMAMVNDGTKKYDHNTDGGSQQLAGCLRDFRNKPFPVKAKIEYYNKALTLSVHTGMSSNKDDYELCLRAENVELPAEGYFGISAATGGLAEGLKFETEKQSKMYSQLFDDHDVHSFLTHSLIPAPEQPIKEGAEVSEDEKKKFEQEFDEYYQKLQKAKDEYKKEHPDAASQDGMEPEDYEEWFESQDERQLKQIYDGQSALHVTIRELSRKLDEVVGRQERTISQISMMSQAGGQVQQGGQQQGGTQQVLQISAVQAQINTFTDSQRDLQKSLREISDSVRNLKIPAASTGSAGGQYANEQSITDLKNSVANMHNDVRSISANKGGCPPPPPVNCVSTFYLFIFLSLQVIVIIGYSMYRSNKDAAAKKFY